MSQKTYTEREVILRERAAFVIGRKRSPCANDAPDCAACEQSANERYPLPKVTQARIVVDPHGASFGITIDQVFLYWKVEGSSVVPCDHSGAVISPPNSAWSPAISIERIAVWADLLANPTEEVEAVA